MARVMIDSGVFGEKWFKDIFEEIQSNDNVRFTYTDHLTMTSELDKARKLGAFYRIMGDKGRRDDVAAKATAKHIALLEANDVWKREAACDDARIFAIVYEKPTPFVFTTDTRLAKCRDKMNQVVKSRYCDFRLIASKANYAVKRQEVLA